MDEQRIDERPAWTSRAHMMISARACGARGADEITMDVEEDTGRMIGHAKLSELRRASNSSEDECVADPRDFCSLEGPKVVLLRHGESEWNVADRFTGWQDVPLSARGAEQALQAARLLREEGLCFSTVYCSKLQRTIKTAWLILEELNLFTTPIVQAWQLNERMYGALTGLNKAATRLLLGEVLYEEMRREPPPLESDSCYNPSRGQLSREVPGEDLPLKESFEDTRRRVMPYWEAHILPHAIETDEAVLVISSKNLLRSLIMGITDMPMEQAIELDIPNGVPLVYDVNSGILSGVGSAAHDWPRRDHAS